MIESVLYSCTHATFRGESEQGKPLDRALEYAEKRGLRVFGHERQLYSNSSRTGRYFIVTSYHSFFTKYMNRCLQRRTYHEYIQGACNLYMDIDAERYGNPGLYEDDKACELVVDAVLCELRRRYSIERSSVEIIELDCSTEVKLSRHYVFNIRDADGRYTVGWRSSRHCGLFMRAVASKIDRRRHAGLFVLGGKKDRQRKFIVDLQPYGNKKCLRTYMSCKPGDCRRLLRTREEKTAGITEPNFLTFLKSMICFFVGNESGQLSRVLTVTEKQKRVPGLAQGQIDAVAGLVRSAKRAYCADDDSSTGIELPAEYMELVKSTLQCRMYSARYNEETQTLRTWVYSKYCAIKGDEHEHNHVFYVFNFGTGMYYQGCLVDACGGRYSEPQPIPDYVPSCKRRKLEHMICLRSLFPLKSFEPIKTT